MIFTALVVAAGRGVRAGQDGPKQYQRLGQATVLEHALRALLAHPDCAAALTVIHAEDHAAYARIAQNLNDPRLSAPVIGGATRQSSVRAGLEALSKTAPEVVLVHDAARPGLPLAVIDRVLAALRPGLAVLPALPVVDTLWRAEGAAITAQHPRDGLWRAQTPQGFYFQDLYSAHATADPAATDDIAVARAAGLQAQVVLGDEANFKITQAQDFQRAETLLRS